MKFRIPNSDITVLIDSTSFSSKKTISPIGRPAAPDRDFTCKRISSKVAGRHASMSPKFDLPTCHDDTDYLQFTKFGVFVTDTFIRTNLAVSVILPTMRVPARPTMRGVVRKRVVTQPSNPINAAKPTQYSVVKNSIQRISDSILFG
jgi:hypothetical protein